MSTIWRRYHHFQTTCKYIIVKQSLILVELNPAPRVEKPDLARYLGQAKTHLQHLMTAAIMNVMRMLRWLAEEPKAKTPQSTFARLYQAVT